MASFDRLSSLDLSFQSPTPISHAAQPPRASTKAVIAAQNWKKKAHDMAVAGVGFGLLGRGYDVNPIEKEAFFEKYLKLNDDYGY